MRVTWEGRLGKADMGRRPARPRNDHFSRESEWRNDTFGTGCQFLDSREPGGRPEEADMGRRPARPQDGHYSKESE